LRTTEIKIQCPNEIKLSSSKKDKEQLFIFCDFDGVLTNWLDAAAKICDIDPKDPKIRQELKKGTYLDKLGMITDKAMWENIDECGTDFWSDLQNLPWTTRIVQETRSLGELYFLTSPGSCLPASSGKMMWLSNNFPDLLDKLIICKDKHVFAGKNRFLIDDDIKKIEMFRKHGGHAFQWPNQYKLLDGDEDVERVLDRLIHEIKACQDEL